MALFFIFSLAFAVRFLSDCETQFFSWKDLGSECKATIGEIKNQKVFLMSDTYMVEFLGNDSEKYRVLARDNRFRIQDSNNNGFEFYPVHAIKENIEGKKGNIILTKIHGPVFRFNVSAGGRNMYITPREFPEYDITFEWTFARFWDIYEFDNGYSKYQFNGSVIAIKPFQKQPEQLETKPTDVTENIPVTNQPKDKNACYQEFALLLPLSKECQKYKTQSVQDTKIYMFEEAIMLDVNAETPYRILVEANLTTIVDGNGANIFHPKDVSLTKDLKLFRKLEKREIYFVEVQKERIYFDMNPTGYVVIFKNLKIYFLNTHEHTLVIETTQCDIKTRKCITK